MESVLNKKNRNNAFPHENTRRIFKESLKRTADSSSDASSDSGGKKRILGDITNQTIMTRSKSGKLGNLQGEWKDGTKISLGSPGKEVFKEPAGHKGNLNKKLSVSSKSSASSDDSIMYVTALDINDSDSAIDVSMVKDEVEENVEPMIESEQQLIPDDVEDFDKATSSDPYSVSDYAIDIFNYYFEREKLFPITPYLDHQKEMTKVMRAILVDWMVEVQESFELNHETLYLAVKLVDTYLMHHQVPKPKLQLIGASAVFVAAKFDERQPPLVDDFLYICDDSYRRAEFLEMEIKLLKTVNFDLGIPVSYRFLRRFARCARIQMDLLTLARFILETSLMDYDLIQVLDSKMAAGALLLALKMKGQKWTRTLEFYTGYTEGDLQDVIIALNKNISVSQSKHLQTIRTKYSHPVFFQVAKIPPLKMIKCGTLVHV